MADLATWQQRKDEAEEALHTLMTGARVSEVGASDSSRTRYADMTAAELQSYIQFCDRKIAEATGNFARKPIYLVGGR